MNQRIFNTNFIAGLVIILLTLSYCLLPSENCSADALCYAADARYGNNLFQPHHLLYTFFNHIAYRAVNAIVAVDVLHFMALINALFAGGCLLLLYRLLCLRQHGFAPLLGTLFLGCSFGFMRFSVEAEAYIIPLFFSLLASYGFCKCLLAGSGVCLLLSALSAVLSVLFHQVHLFWALALFVGLLFHSWRKALLFALVMLLVPVAYMFVVVFYEKLPCSLDSLWRYLANYYYSGEGHMTISTVNLLMTPISLFRTFVQVHGNLMFFTGYLLFVVLLVFVSLVMAVCTFRSWRFFKPVFMRVQLFEWTMVIAFFMQLLFAFLSDGNAEFMVMLPALFVLSIPVFASDRSPLCRAVFVGSCFVWNMAVAIVPQHVLDYYNTQAVVSFVNEKGNCKFISSDYYTIVNRNYYETGIDLDPRFLKVDPAIFPDSLLNGNVPVYSDICAYPVFYSRSTLVAGVGQCFDENVQYKPVFFYSGAFGEYKIDSLYVR